MLLEEEDGIKLLGASEMLQMAGDDLRRSIGPNQGQTDGNVHLREQLALLRELEKVKTERDELKKSREQLQREILNQTFGKCAVP